MMRVYADFNDTHAGRDAQHLTVGLQGFGTLRDLCAARLRLKNDLVLTLWSDSAADEDIEVEATVWWEIEPKYPRGGRWVADYDPKQLRYLPSSTDAPKVSAWFPCYGCGVNLADGFDWSQMPPNSICQHCGTPVGLSLSPPET